MALILINLAAAALLYINAGYTQIYFPICSHFTKGFIKEKSGTCFVITPISPRLYQCVFLGLLDGHDKSSFYLSVFDMYDNMESICEESKCIITTKDGPICGYIDNTDGIALYKFKSIPYARPPLGRLRFLPPSPVAPWTDLKDCTQDAPVPMQFYLAKEILGSEDCLYLEISTPKPQAGKALPVMFWIGCYSFSFFMDPIYDPTLLNAQDVVFVRCGFRLGPFGFLSINDFTAPGNCGLKDIVMALTWVQRNIYVFGGDPTNVTIFGSSTGGTIVHMMTLSPMATGLFHKAIIQSASALNNWALAKNPSQPVLELAKILGIETTDKVEIVEELRSIDKMDIMKAFIKIFDDMIGDQDENIFETIFKPNVEEEFESQPAFLTRWPLKILNSGNFNKVPIMIGSNNIEAALLQFLNKDFYKDFEKFNKNLDLLVPRSLSGETNQSKRIGQQLLKFYLGGEEYLREDTKSQYLQLLTDYFFLYYVNKTVRLHSQLSPEFPIYYYILNFAGEWVVPELYNWFNSMGHSAEIPFIFRLKFPDSPEVIGSRDSLITRDRVVRMWTNFAKYGNPTPDEHDPLLQINWDPVENQNKLNYLSIGAELTKGRNPFRERMAFWEDLHKEHTFLRALVIFNDLGISW